LRNRAARHSKTLSDEELQWLREQVGFRPGDWEREAQEKREAIKAERRALKERASSIAQQTEKSI
jgi:hypothetical protein